MLESRFYPYVMVLGDINKEQAKTVIEVAQKLTEFPLSLPVFTDAHHLIERLRLYLKDSELIEQGRNLFRGDDTELWKSIVAMVDKNKAGEAVKENLKSFAPSQIGAIKTMTSYLNATEDVVSLCRAYIRHSLSLFILFQILIELNLEWLRQRQQPGYLDAVPRRDRRKSLRRISYIPLQQPPWIEEGEPQRGWP